MSDWIKLHRILLEWEWYTTPNMAHFWVYCLLKASHKDRLWRGILLKEGQFLSGRFVMAAETGLSERQIRTCVERLKTTNEMTSQSTTEYTVFTINSWNKYQILQTSDQRNDQRATNERPTSDHRQEGNKDKNVKKNTEYSSDFLAFWAAWPDSQNKDRKMDSAKSLKQALTLTTLVVILASIEKWKLCEKWKNGFVNNPSNWLKGRCWEIDPPINPPKETAFQQANREFQERKENQNGSSNGIFGRNKQGILPSPQAAPATPRSEDGSDCSK